MSRIIGITGGIGSGKSVVSDVLRAMGYTVYDCDSEARGIMERDAEMRERIFSEVCEEARNADDSINRQVLARKVFGSPELLRRLESIVHGAVRADLIARASGHDLIFFESAILYSSGFWEMADSIWEITAPEAVRLERAMNRDHATADSIRARMASQTSQQKPPQTEPVVIVNDGIQPLLPQIERALGEPICPDIC